MSFNSLLTNLQLEHFAKIELHMRDSWSIKKVANMSWFSVANL